MGGTKLFVLLFMMAPVTGNAITTEQRPVEVVAGTDAYLPCMPIVDKPVVWQSPGPSYDEISFGGQIRQNYRERFDLSSPGQYSLRIKRTVPGDSGEYRCIEDNGIGLSHIVVLDVREAAASSQFSTDPSVATKVTSSSTTTAYTQVSDIISAQGQLIALITAIVVLVLVLLVASVAIIILFFQVNNLRNQVNKYRDKHLSLIQERNDQ